MSSLADNDIFKQVSTDTNNNKTINAFNIEPRLTRLACLQQFNYARFILDKIFGTQVASRYIRNIILSLDAKIKEDKLKIIPSVIQEQIKEQVKICVYGNKYNDSYIYFLVLWKRYSGTKVAFQVLTIDDLMR